MSRKLLAIALLCQAGSSLLAAPSSQELFNAATEDASLGRCAEAISKFEQLEARPSLLKVESVRIAVLIRKNTCLMSGPQSETAEQVIRDNLPKLIAQGDGFRAEVRDLHLLLGSHRTRKLDYATAIADLKAGLALSEGDDRVRPLFRLSGLLMFDKDGEALKYATELRALVLNNKNQPNLQKSLAQTIYARVLLNAGRHAEAYAELKDGRKKQGAMGLSVTRAEITTRSDLAIAAMLNNLEEDAQRYLAYTGAGRMKDTVFASGLTTELPPCGGDDGLKPDDLAIVEFSLAEDGTVISAAPVYTPGSRQVALAFTRAVMNWTIKPEQAKKVPEFFRVGLRVELRCTNAGDRPQLTQPLLDATISWINEINKETKVNIDAVSRDKIPAYRESYNKAVNSGDRSQALLYGTALASSLILETSQRRAILQELIAFAKQQKAPASVITYYRYSLATLEGYSKPSYFPVRNSYRSILADADVQSDPFSMASMALLVATPMYKSREPADAEQLLTSVINASGLSKTHPLKVNALLQLANLYGAKGDMVRAKETFQKTGLTTEQCALIGIQPAMQRRASLPDFPDLAQAYGFEGMNKVEFDISTDGSIITPRAVVSYPPFVFNKTSTKWISKVKYSTSYRPEDQVACSATSTAMFYKMPD
jgi:hypothetical protein